jgi:exonuclease SbcD
MSQAHDTVYFMRIAHTSDWHIGRTLHGVDLHEHHAQYFDHLVDLVRSEQIDAVVVSGDVYDRAIPPVSSVELLSDTLARLADTTHVILTPGNHDSAIRLGFGAQLMRPNIHIRSKVASVAEPVDIPTVRGSSPLLVYGLPYLDPDAARPELARCCGLDGPLGEGSVSVAEGAEEQQDSRPTIARSHEAVMSAAMGLVRADLAVRRAGGRVNSLVMAHAFVVGGQASESERDIRVGGVDSVPAGVFEGVDYVALGHLHGAQRVSVPGAVARYSGSPLAFSFSEMNHRKSTAIVTFGDNGVVGEPELITAPVPRQLSEVTGTMEDVLGEGGATYVDDWVRITITDPERPQEMNARLKQRFPHALVMQHSPAGAQRPQRQAIAVNATTDPAQAARQFVEDVTSLPPTAQEQAVLERALDQARAMERSA